MVVCGKKQKHCQDNELEAGDGWIGISLAQDSGLILSARVGKHTDEFIEELVVSTEGKTACLESDTDAWGGYERVLNSDVDHYIGKALTQRNERTNAIWRQQTGRWHRRQNMRDWRGNPSSANSRKFGKIWEQTGVIVRLVISYFNWIWQHSQLKTTAAQRAGLTSDLWSWADLATYPTLL